MKTIFGIIAIGFCINTDEQINKGYNSVLAKKFGADDYCKKDT